MEMLVKAIAVTCVPIIELVNLPVWRSFTHVVQEDCFELFVVSPECLFPWYHALSQLVYLWWLWPGM